MARKDKNYNAKLQSKSSVSDFEDLYKTLDAAHVAGRLRSAPKRKDIGISDLNLLEDARSFFEVQPHAVIARQHLANAIAAAAAEILNQEMNP
jgi:hypothetical protein